MSTYAFKTLHKSRYCLIAGMAAVLCSCDDAKLASFTQGHKAPVAKSVSVAETSNLELWARCSQEATKAAALGSLPGKASVTSHYNARLEKCFLRIDNTNSTDMLTTRSISLFDVFDGKEYGEFLRSLGPQDSVETVPVLCRVIVSERDESCVSPEEFTALAKHYME